jgi:hypothetical protein
LGNFYYDSIRNLDVPGCLNYTASGLAPRLFPGNIVPGKPGRGISYPV